MHPLIFLYGTLTWCSIVLFNNGFCLGFNSRRLPLSPTLVARGLCSLGDSCLQLNLLQYGMINPSPVSHPLSPTLAKYFIYAPNSKGHFVYSFPWFHTFSSLIPLLPSLWLKSLCSLTMVAAFIVNFPSFPLRLLFHSLFNFFSFAITSLCYFWFALATHTNHVFSQMDTHNIPINLYQPPLSCFSQTTMLYNLIWSNALTYKTIVNNISSL